MMPNPINRTSQNRAVIHRIFSKERSLILRGDALRWIEDMLAHYNVAPEDLEETLMNLVTGCESEATLRGLDQPFFESSQPHEDQ